MQRIDVEKEGACFTQNATAQLSDGYTDASDSRESSLAIQAAK